MMGTLLGPAFVGCTAALAAGCFLIPVLRRLRARQVISSDAPEAHRAKGGTPTMGGLIILSGALCGALLWPRTSGAWNAMLAVLAATLAFGLIGFLDDYLIIRRGKNLGLRAREKLAGQFLVAIIFAGWRLGADPVGADPGRGLFEPDRLLLAAYHVLLLVGLSNAVNLTDGLDGLAAGVSLPVWIALALMGAFWSTSPGTLGGGVGDWGIVAICSAFAGATLGYLWFNAHPAQVFMGDTGSLAIGGAMGAAAIVLRLEWILLLAALVHLAEAASVTLQVASFRTTGRRIFRMSPLHHHFELCEWPETRIVTRFSVASCLCALTALLLFFRS